jgi:hypothetical protein
MLQLLQISCHKATELVEKKINLGLSWKERLQLHYHLKACAVCKYYEDQSLFLEKWIAHIENLENTTTDISEEEVEALIDKILKENNDKI